MINLLKEAQNADIMHVWDSRGKMFKPNGPMCYVEDL